MLLHSRKNTNPRLRAAHPARRSPPGGDVVLQGGVAGRFGLCDPRAGMAGTSSSGSVVDWL